MRFCPPGRIARLAVFFLALSVPFARAGAAPTAPAAPVRHYATAMTELYGPSSPTPGTLDLHVDANGIIHGYYHPAGVRSFDPVSGGLDGVHVWLDIGDTASMHVTGTVSADGTIDGQAWNDDVDAQYRFVATPVSEPTPSPSPAAGTASQPGSA